MQMSSSCPVWRWRLASHTNATSNSTLHILCELSPSDQPHKHSLSDQPHKQRMVRSPLKNAQYRKREIISLINQEIRQCENNANIIIMPCVQMASRFTHKLNFKLHFTPTLRALPVRSTTQALPIRPTTQALHFTHFATTPRQINNTSKGWSSHL